MYVGTYPGSHPATFDAGLNTSFILPTARSGQQYYFAVAAYNAAGVGRPEVAGFSNAPPSLFNPGDQMVPVGSPTVLRVNGSDPDGDALTYGACNLPVGLNIAPSTGAVSGTPTQVGTYAVTAWVTDGVFTDKQWFNWRVLEPPPPAVSLVSPSGTLTTAATSFAWNAVATASDYTLRIEDTRSILFQQTYTAAALGCNAGAQCRTPAITVAPGGAQWQVLASNGAGDGPWSTALTITQPPPPVSNNTAPILAITNLKSTVFSVSTPYWLTVRHTATDNIGVTQVSWTNSLGGSGTAIGMATWKLAVQVRVEQQTIVVTARDAAGNTATEWLIITGR